MYLAVAAGTDEGSRLIEVEGVEGGRFSMWAGVKPGLVAVSVEDNEARRPQIRARPTKDHRRTRHPGIDRQVVMRCKGPVAGVTVSTTVRAVGAAW